MSELRNLFELAAGSPRAEVDPAADLARARTAARARKVRRLRLGTASLALIAVAGVGVAQVLANEGSTGPGAPGVGSAAAVHLVDSRFDADPYTFDLTPRGWHVQSQTAFAVSIAPDDGSTSEDPNDFVGKLVILFDQNEVSGKTVVVSGREFWIGSNTGYTTISTRTRGDEPSGVVRVQYPNDAGWTMRTMLAFLGSVHVGPGARPGQG